MTQQLVFVLVLEQRVEDLHIIISEYTELSHIMSPTLCDPITHKASSWWWIC